MTKPLSINRCDSNFLLKRSGAKTGFDGKKILQIGLGSVGSQISIGLVNAGIKNLTLVDNDKFQKENLFRHILSKKDIG